MTGKILTFAAAAGLLVASATIGYAESRKSAQMTGDKIQEKGPANARTASADVVGNLVREDAARPGGAAFAASQDTTGNIDPRQTYDRGPSIPSDKH